MAKRRFEASVIPLGVQTHEGRFGKRRRGNDYDEDWPKIAQWRCNLAGLSSRHNLFFCAYSDSVYVYVPQFPSQALPPEPALIVTSQPSSPSLPGYLDQRNPHAINNLVVQFLGNEEVVAAVRDDGDVDAFLVRHIVQAIQRRAEAGNSIGKEADELRPFFQSNVGKSAWGLAIHTEARILAVSANTHNITVFKFGLVEAKAESEQGIQDEESSEAAEDRASDVTYQVINGTSNIPSIAFCNTGDDLEGKWLLTTDIGGFCRTIALETMQTSNTFRFGPATRYLSSHDRFNSGWGIMFLDRRSFLPENDFHAALGLPDGESLPSSLIWDIGESISHVADNGSKFTAQRRYGARSEERRSLPIASPSSRSQSEHPSESSPDLHGEEPVTQHAYEDVLAEVLAEGIEEDDSIADAALDFDDDYDSDGESTYHADLDFDDEGIEDASSASELYGGRRLHGNVPRASQPDKNICGDLPCPILHTSVRNVYLLQPGNLRGPDPPFGLPTVGFSNALHQLVQGEFAWLNMYERLNMSCYIPALGIVVIASQKGRAMVLSLSKLSRSTRYPANMTDFPCQKKPIYAMRIERILPLAQQEERMERPFAPLHGIATGPIQGTEHLPDEQKRWRLLMMYADHSILSYEISRQRARDSAIDIRSLIV